MGAAKTFFSSFLQGFGLEGFGERRSIPGAPVRLFAKETPKSQGKAHDLSYSLFWEEDPFSQRHYVRIDLDSLDTNPDTGKLSAKECHRVVTMLEDTIRLINEKKRMDLRVPGDERACP